MGHTESNACGDTSSAVRRSAQEPTEVTHMAGAHVSAVGVSGLKAGEDVKRRNLLGTTVLYHANCPDGHGAAYAAWTLFRDHQGTKHRYVAVTHGNPVPQIREGVDLYILDFCYPREILLDLAKRHPKVVVIDHHAPAAKELEGITNEADNIEVIFNNNYSGATLSWKYFRGSEPPLLLQYVQDRDLWRFELPLSKEISAALFSYEQSFPVWDELATTPDILLTTLVTEGTAILRMQQSRVEALLKDARVARVGGFTVPAVNAPYFLASDIGNELLNKFPHAPFSAVYRDAGDGRRDWSLRSLDSREDVQQIAKIYGGGGHRNAAGCAESPGEREIVLLDGQTYADVEQAYLEEEEAGLTTVREEGVV